MIPLPRTPMGSGACHQQQNICIIIRKKEATNMSKTSDSTLSQVSTACSCSATNLPSPAPARAWALGAGRGEREDLRPQQHERGPEAARVVVEAELAGVHELAQQLLGHVHRHHLHHRGAAVSRRRRRLRSRRGGAQEVQERRRRCRHVVLIETDECMGVQDGRMFLDG